jgi:hypothetical protein
MADFESDYIAIVEKFKDYEGLVTGDDVKKKKNVTRGKGLAQHRRNLLAHAVSNGIALPNSKEPTDNKYGVYFNINDSPYLGNEYFFDLAVLTSDRILNLPPREILLEDLSISQQGRWELEKERWVEVHRVFCVYQQEGIIKLKSSNVGDKWFRQDSLLRIKFYLALYKALKTGWSATNINETKVGWAELDFNEIFLEYLHHVSVFEFASHFRPSTGEIKYQAAHEHLIEIRKAVEKGVRKPEDYGEGFEGERQPLERAIDFFSKEIVDKPGKLLNRVRDYIETIDDIHTKKALGDLKDVEVEQMKFIVNRARQLREKTDKRSGGLWDETTIF